MKAKSTPTKVIESRAFRVCDRLEWGFVHFTLHGDPSKHWDKVDDEIADMRREDPNVSRRFLQQSGIREASWINGFFASYLALRTARDGSLTSRLASVEFQKFARKMLEIYPTYTPDLLTKMEKTLSIHKLSEEPALRVGGMCPATCDKAFEAILPDKLKALAKHLPMDAMREIKNIFETKGIANDLRVKLVDVYAQAATELTSKPDSVRRDQIALEGINNLTWAALYMHPGTKMKQIVKAWKNAAATTVDYLAVNVPNTHTARREAVQDLLHMLQEDACGALLGQHVPYNKQFAERLVNLCDNLSCLPKEVLGLGQKFLQADM